jgi:putative transcriptional regulator
MKNALVKNRKEKRFTQQEIANRVGISRQYYSEIENNRRKPSVDTAKKIGKLLGVDWTIFF